GGGALRVAGVGGEDGEAGEGFGQAAVVVEGLPVAEAVAVEGFGAGAVALNAGEGGEVGEGPGDAVAVAEALGEAFFVALLGGRRRVRRRLPRGGAVLSPIGPHRGR